MGREEFLGLVLTPCTLPYALRPEPCGPAVIMGLWMARANVPANWPELPDEQLLDLRLADLPLKLEGTVIEGRLAQLRSELEARELRFPVHFYISDEWFTPDGTAAMAVPFYMTHPRLERLEKAQMLEVEGGEHDWCMRILRHEAGHVVDNAYRLRLRQHRRALFGRSNEPYPEFYDPNHTARCSFSTSTREYAESSRRGLRRNLRGLADAGRQLEAALRRVAGAQQIGDMDTLMRSLRGRKPLVESTDEVDPLRRLRRTLRQHYRRKRRHHGVDHPKFYDRELRRLFSDAPEFST